MMLAHTEQDLFSSGPAYSSVGDFELQAQTSWFHVFRDMICSCDLAKLDGSAIKCYLVIKSFANFNTGQAFPALETIAQGAGLSESQVKRAIKQLEAFGYVLKEKKGRNNTYILREKVQILDEEGKQTAVASWDYVPRGVRDAVADLKNVLMEGDLAGAKVVHIEKMHVQIVNADHNQGVVMVAGGNMGVVMPDLAEKNPALFEKIAELKARRKK